MALIDAHKLRSAALLLHFDARWAAGLLDGAVLGLNDDEKRLLRAVDARGFRADEERKARAVFAIVEEAPVAVAVAGLPAVFAFFVDAAFLDVVVGGAPLVVRALEFLGGPAARIEACVARARRRRRARGPLTLCAGVDGDSGFVAGAVERWAALRGELRAADVMAGARRSWGLKACDEREGVVVDNGLVDPRVASCSPSLGRLLAAARAGHDVVAVAQAEGCDDAEAEDVVADLVNDGLLAPKTV